MRSYMILAVLALATSTVSPAMSAPIRYRVPRVIPNSQPVDNPYGSDHVSIHVDDNSAAGHPTAVVNPGDPSEVPVRNPVDRPYSPASNIHPPTPGGNLPAAGNPGDNPARGRGGNPAGGRGGNPARGRGGNPAGGRGGNRGGGRVSHWNLEQMMMRPFL